MHVKNLQSTISKLNRHHKEYLESKNIEVKRNSFKCLLPEHVDENASAKFRNEEEGKVHCFGCQSNYDILDSYAILEEKPRPGEPGWIKETLLPLAELYSIDIQYQAPSAEEEIVLTGYRLNNDVTDFISNSSLTKEVKSFTKKRNIDNNLLAELNIGTIPSYKELKDYLIEKRGWTEAQLKEYNIDRQDIFSPVNLTTPIRDKQRNILGFNSRNTEFDKEKNPEARKFVHSPNSNIYNKSNSLFGIDVVARLIKRGLTSKVYIVEGMFDWIRLYSQNIKNVVALNGSAMSKHHFDELRSIGVCEVILLLDSDDAGQKATELIINNSTNWEGIRLSILCLPTGEDPDSYLLNHTVEEFNVLELLSVHSWKRVLLAHKGKSAEEIVEVVCRSLAGEKDPIISFKERRLLSEDTEIPEDVLREKIDQIKERVEEKLKTEIENLVKETTGKLSKDPQQGERYAQELILQLRDIQSQNSEDGYSSLEVLDALNTQEQREAQKEGGLDGYAMPSKPVLQNVLYGPWRHNHIFLMGGKPNVGKTNFITDLSLEILRNNDGIKRDAYDKTTEKTIVLYHTIDDARVKIINRMATNIAADYFNTVSLNMIANPNLYINQAVNKEEAEKFLIARAKAYNELRELIIKERLFIKEMKHGTTLDYIHSWLGYVRRKYPADQYSILYILDNLSKVDTKENTRDQAEARKISEGMKKIVNLYDVSAICTVEYTKLQNGATPTDNDLRDTNQLRYDADVIAHLINELTENVETSKFWRSKNRFDLTLADDQLDVTLPKWPVVDLFVTKNKSSEYRDTHIYSDMVPTQAKCREIPTIILDQRIDNNKLLSYKQE